MDLSADENRRGFGFEKACRLSNTIHSEIAPCLSLPSLPVFCGALNQDLYLFEESTNVRALNRPEILAQASKIVDLLKETDVSYLCFRDKACPVSHISVEPSSLHSEVLHHDSEAFNCSTPGPIKEQILRSSPYEKKSFEHTVHDNFQAQKVSRGVLTDHSDGNLSNDPPTSNSSRKQKNKRRESEGIPFPNTDVIVRRFCEMLEDFCGRAEIPIDDQGEMEELSLPLSDIKMLVNEIMTIRSKNVLHLVPVDMLVRLLNVLDRLILRGHALSIEENDTLDSDIVSLVMSALESTHAVLAIMTHRDMPKQLYKEEIIEKIIDFSKHQIMESMLACDPSYRALHRPSENDVLNDFEDDDDDDADIGSAGKRNRRYKSTKVKRPAGNKISAPIYAVLQKICTILGCLKDLLSIEHLSDSCVLQLVKISFTTFVVDNMQLLQLKAIDLICAVFTSYTQHRNFLIDETHKLLWKLPFSKRSLRAYHLPDEEQRQIQMITALLIQLVQCSANLSGTLGKTLASDIIPEVANDASYPIKCHESATEACCLFWKGVLHRLATVKSQELSELKTIMENLVMDLLTTLNLPEYPASAHILEVLCCFLLQNAGLKSKDVSARCMAIDLLGMIAERLKRDAVLSKRENFWILQELVDGEVPSILKDACSICLDGKGGKCQIVCCGCQRCFHGECIGQDIATRAWFCQLCACKKQLIHLQSSEKLQADGNREMHRCKAESSSDASRAVTPLEVVQQMLLNYLLEAGSTNDADAHLIARWFNLCLWYKDDPKSQENFIYYISRLKPKAIVRDFGISSSSLTRASAKKLSLALGQKSSFARGFDTILDMLLASLRENSPVLRAKALRAVSVIVEADPEVLCEKHVQCAVEGRFCDSAISAREAALELVGRHIASHPDVGFQYFEKVAERIKDTGVSVRKRAIKIIRDMCISNANFSESTSACIQIITRVNDEESSIQDLVCRTFYEFWFEEPSNTETQYVGDGSSSVPLEIAKKTEQVVEILRKMPNHQLLVSVIKRNLQLDFFPQSVRTIGINAVSLASVRKRCELMCKCLLERILQVVEMNNEEMEVRALPYVLALHAFCLVEPQLCAPPSDPSQFIVTLQPYLKSQVNNRAVAQLLQSIIFVIDAVLPLLRKPPASVVEELEQDLKHMIVRHSFLTVVHACIRCLCSLSKITGKCLNSIGYLIQRFFKILDTSRESLGAHNKQQVERSLVCLGLLVRYGANLIFPFDNQSGQFIKILSLVKNYLCLEDFGLKVRSLQALGSILIARPVYMLEKDIGKIVQATLSRDSDARIKLQALQNVYEYLLDMESQMEANPSSNTVTHAPEDARHKVPIAAGAGESNICGGIVQLHWNNILERCLDVNDQVRQSALKIVEVVLRQGLVHPITAVPYLIALETDHQDVNSKLAHQLLVNMNEKYPTFFESRLGDGLQMSFTFIRSLSDSSPGSYDQNMVSGNARGRSVGSISSYAKTGISRIYRLIRGNRISRNKFMSSIVAKFNSGSWNHSALPFLIYCTEVLASIPFTSPDEPLYLIYRINQVIQVRAGALESSLKSFSSNSLQRDVATTHENGTVEKQLEADLTNTKDERGDLMNTDDSCSISKDNLQKFQADCHEAIALQLLLKLKRHLKISYNLSDTRCQAFSPTEPLKQGEVLSRQNVAFDIKGTIISLPTTLQEMLEIYQKFKALLKEDTVDYSTYVANVKRKRPRASSAIEAENGQPVGKMPSRNTRSGKQIPEYGNEDDDDDDDGDDDYWGSGPRKLVGSVRKTNNRRRKP